MNLLINANAKRISIADNSVNCVVTSEELRADPDNLILLCADCHHWVHSNENINDEFIRKE